MSAASGLRAGTVAVAIGLGAGSGNPPPGWGNPYQAGTMTLVSAGDAVFTDRAGHRVVFPR